MTTVKSVKKRAVKRAVKKAPRKNTATSVAVTNAMKEAMEVAKADANQDVEIAVSDVVGEQALIAKAEGTTMPTAHASAELLHFPNNETMQRALTQTANSIQYFAMNAIAWGAGTALTGFGEKLDRAKFSQMLAINSSYENYFTDGTSADTGSGVDAPETDSAGHVDLHASAGMDSGTDTRKRLNAGAWKILQDNVQRFEECVVIQKRLEGYGIVPNQNLKDERVQLPDGSFRDNEGVVTKIIKGYNIRQEENLVKWRAKQQGDAVQVATGNDALADSMASAYDI